ncbi:DUF805 domain-containing protein [Erwiniaceae bacterium CAU 1747]
MSWYISALKKYAQFTGRSRRKEFWMFTLCNLIILAVLGILLVSSQPGIFHILVAIIMMIYTLAVLIPSIAVCVRRLHDTNRSGWFYLMNFIPLVSIILLVFLCMPGTKGINNYGSDPKP